MTRAAWFVTLALAAAVRAGDDRPARKVADPALQAGINRAIDRGVAYLKFVQRADGSWGRGGGRGRREGMADDFDAGFTALVLYALAASRVPRDDPAIRRGIAWTETHREPYTAQGSRGTYCASLLILALTRIDPEEHNDRIRRLAEQLAASQLDDGMWAYRLRSGRTGSDATPLGRGDNSNSQFAVLALWAAQALAGFDVPKETWRSVRKLYRGTQAPDGGWPYTGGGSPTGTMTAAGLVSYVYAEAALSKRRDPLEWARKLKTTRRGRDAFVKYLDQPPLFDNKYFVYSVERVGTVAGLPDGWYEKGARILVDAQLANGAWNGSSGHEYGTSLSLLFLSRATRHSLTKRERFPDPGRELARAFDFYHGYKPEARSAVAAEFGAAGPAVVGFLIEKLDDRNESVRASAYELLLRLLDRKFLFEPAAPPFDRAFMLVPIEAYWHDHGKSLRWDESRGKFFGP